MKKLPVQSVHEALIYSPGVDIRQRGPVGVQADLGIRGGTFEQSLVLINGIKMSDPQTGHHIMSLPFSLDDVARIEVLKGPGSRIFGQNAFAGAVNFITTIPEERELSIRGYGGGFGSYGGNIGLSLPGTKYKQRISIAHDASDGHRHNTDYRISNIFYQSELEALGGSFELIGGFVDRKFGANGFYASPEATEQYEEVSTSILSIGYSKRYKNMQFKPRVYWRWNDDRYLFIRDNPEVYENHHQTNVFGAELNNSIESSAGTTGIGLEFRKEMIGGDQVRGGNSSASIIDGASRDNVGVFAEHRFKLAGRLDITPGVYVNWYSDFGWNAFPGIDLGYNINTHVRLYANAGRSYRIPTFYDQYYESPTEQGDPDLQPEEAMTYEVGVKYAGKGINAEFNFFHRDASQLIDWVYNTSDSIWQSKNLGSVKISGMEWSLGLNFNQIISEDLPIHSVFISYNYIDRPINQDEAVRSRYALRNIRNQLIFGLEHRWFLKLKNSFRARYIDRQEQGPYWVLDNRIYWEENEKLNIFLDITNLLDQEYTEVLAPMPGRWFRAGVQWKISI
jgi:iron complex outermembrane receptor protein